MRSFLSFPANDPSLIVIPMSCEERNPFSKKMGATSFYKADRVLVSSKGFRMYRTIRVGKRGLPRNDMHGGNPWLLLTYS